MPVAAGQVFAAGETAQAGIVEAGNKKCPVMGEPVNGQDFVVSQGKRYALCCPACEQIFLNDPAKFIAPMDSGERSSASGSQEMERDMEPGSL